MGLRARCRSLVAIVAFALVVASCSTASPTRAPASEAPGMLGASERVKPMPSPSVVPPTVDGPGSASSPVPASPLMPTDPSAPASSPQTPSTEEPDADQTLPPETTPVSPIFDPDGPWVPAGKDPWTTEGHGLQKDLETLVPLGDGGALALASDAATASRWAPDAVSWVTARALPTSRIEYAAVALADGRVLVAGGLDTSDFDRLQSYSSAYVFAPGTGTWTKTGLMATARAAPAAAVLPDGRVLVAGGAYIDGPGYGLGAPLMTTVASASAAGSASGRDQPLADIAPPTMGVAMATAEVFDPRTGRWSSTGAMRYAVAGAVAATLTDGRVLVVAPGTGVPGWGWVDMDARARDTAEVYDPATGRFTLVGSLPPIDWSRLEGAGISGDGFRPRYSSPGTLVALPAGDALLVGNWRSEHNGRQVTRSFRYHGATGTWTQVGPTWGCGWVGAQPEQTCLAGIDLSGAAVAPMRDGRVLVAGGRTRGTRATDIVRAYDAGRGTWDRLDAMPLPRFDGRTALLADGSILVAGGDDGTWHRAPPIRYVPPD